VPHKSIRNKPGSILPYQFLAGSTEYSLLATICEIRIPKLSLDATLRHKDSHESNAGLVDVVGRCKINKIYIKIYITLNLSR
jgi:hypothetical protein